MKNKLKIFGLLSLLGTLILPSLSSCSFESNRRPGIDDNSDINFPDNGGSDLPTPEPDKPNSDPEPDVSAGDTFKFFRCEETYSSITLYYDLGSNTHIQEIKLKNADTHEVIKTFDYDVREITDLSRKYYYELEFIYVINDTNEVKIFNTCFYLVPQFSAEFSSINTYTNSISYSISTKNEEYFNLKEIEVYLFDDGVAIKTLKSLEGTFSDLKPDTSYRVEAYILVEDLDVGVENTCVFNKYVRTKIEAPKPSNSDFYIQNKNELEAPWISSETERQINLVANGNFNINEYVLDGLIKITTDNPLLEVVGTKLVRKTSAELGIVKVTIQFYEHKKEVLIPVLKNDEGLTKLNLVSNKSLFTPDFGINESREITFYGNELTRLTYKTYLDNNFQFLNNNTIKAVNEGETLIVFYYGSNYDYIYLEAFDKECEESTYEEAVKKYFANDKKKYFRIPSYVVSSINEKLFVLCDGKDYFLVNSTYWFVPGTFVILNGCFTKNTILKTLNLSDCFYEIPTSKINITLPEPKKTTTEDLIDLFNRGMRFDFENPVYEDFPKTLYIEDEIITCTHNSTYCFADYFRFNIKGYKENLFKLSYGIYSIKGFTNGISSASYDRSFLYIDDYKLIQEGATNIDVKYNLPSVVKTNEIINLLKYTESLPANSTREIFINSETEITGLQKLNVSHLKFIAPGDYEIPLKANSESSLPYIWKVKVVDK